MDAKAWRRTIMSETEAKRFMDRWLEPMEPFGCLIDEFVRRLGEMRIGVVAGDGWRTGNANVLAQGCDTPHCRPAVLFVQEEKPKSLTAEEKIEGAMAALTGKCRTYSRHCDCPVCEAKVILRGEDR